MALRVRVFLHGNVCWLAQRYRSPLCCICVHPFVSAVFGELQTQHSCYSNAPHSLPWHSQSWWFRNKASHNWQLTNHWRNACNSEQLQFKWTVSWGQAGAALSLFKHTVSFCLWSLVLHWSYHNTYEANECELMGWGRNRDFQGD